MQLEAHKSRLLTHKIQQILLHKLQLGKGIENQSQPMKGVVSVKCLGFAWRRKEFGKA